MRPLIDGAERRRRIGARHRIDPACRADSVLAAAEAVACLHGTDHPSIYLSAFARSWTDAAAIDAALFEQRSLVKHLAMRRTVFAIPRGLLPAAHAGVSRRVGRTERTQLVRLLERERVVADPEHWLPTACDDVLTHLAGHPDSPAAAVRDALPRLQPRVPYAQGKDYGGTLSLAPLLLTLLECEGRVVRSGNAVGWHVSRPLWSLTEDWLGGPIPELAEAAGLAQLVAAYLASFGPATLVDVQWWLGHTKAATRTALAEVGAIEVDLEGGTGWVLPTDLAPTEGEDWVALLPPLDPTTMGWKERSFYLGAHGPLVFDTAGNAGPTCWWNGRIVGGWRQDDAGAVVLQLLEDVPGGVRRRLGHEADRLTGFCGGRRVMLRFPSPLWQRPATTGGS